MRECREYPSQMASPLSRGGGVQWTDNDMFGTMDGGENHKAQLVCSMGNPVFYNNRRMNTAHTRCLTFPGLLRSRVSRSAIDSGVPCAQIPMATITRRKQALFCFFLPVEKFPFE